MKRYHPLHVILHWIMAVLILFALFSGDIIPLKIHITTGLIITGFLLIRLVIKFQKRTLLPSKRENTILSRISRIMHFAIYALIIGVIASGLAMAVQAELFQALINVGALQVEYQKLPIHFIHASLTKVLLGTIFLHIIAALFHQFILKDRLFSRMWF